jgi:hypothetical protein
MLAAPVPLCDTAIVSARVLCYGVCANGRGCLRCVPAGTSVLEAVAPVGSIDRPSCDLPFSASRTHAAHRTTLYNCTTLCSQWQGSSTAGARDHTARPMPHAAQPLALRPSPRKAKRAPSSLRTPHTSPLASPLSMCGCALSQHAAAAQLQNRACHADAFLVLFPSDSHGTSARH